MDSIEYNNILNDIKRAIDIAGDDRLILIIDGNNLDEDDYGFYLFLSMNRDLFFIFEYGNYYVIFYNDKDSYCNYPTKFFKGSTGYGSKNAGVNYSHSEQECVSYIYSVINPYLRDKKLDNLGL